MAKDKTPGIDEFPMEFFEKHWEIVKEDVVGAIMEFFNTIKLFKEVSCTTITLIPKVNTPNQVNDFRPIACCSTIYKLITKVLTNRITPVIGTLVSHSQTAFIEGRSIIDNILFIHELLKWYTRKGLSPRCTMKVDLRKAYDSIEWEFLAKLLVGLAFPFKFVNWVMECISTVSYSLIINGGLTSLFQGRRGIGQGDPVPPYLFVLAMEYLQKELNVLNEIPQFKFHPRCKQFGLMHICFANDLLMFCKVDIDSIQLMQDAFQRFFVVSGLQANTEKSSIYVTGVKPDLKQNILATLGYVEGEMPFKYIGVPISSKKLTVAQCMPLVEKITERIRCWIARLLSRPEPTPWAGPAPGDHCWPQANPWPGFLNSAET
ncbi:hypothetical protein KY285_004882 [Solanum tuberosum]|nr:hypothetical protein KY285_004882 [Solanum tuberosum]